MRVVVLTGLAGAGKSAVLSELAAAGEQVLDLEGLAAHRGSSFGRIGIQAPQPTEPEFHALIHAWWTSFDGGRPVWIEDEGPHIGRLWLPDEVTRAIGSARTLRIESPREERVARLAAQYGRADPAELIDATQRMRRRLGNSRADRAISHFHARRPEAAIRVLIEYFDEGYTRRAEHDTRLPLARHSISTVARRVVARGAPAWTAAGPVALAPGRFRRVP